MIWAGALAIQILAFSTTERRVKSATAEAEADTEGGAEALDGSPEDARPMLLELEWE